MLSECLHYQGKAGFLIEFIKWYFSKYWQVPTTRVFVQIVTYTDTHVHMATRKLTSPCKQDFLMLLSCIKTRHRNVSETYQSNS